MVKKMLGLCGEQKALEFLVQNGYSLVEQNYSSRFGEIDLIVKDDKYIVFVEVKTRKQNPAISGLESITPNKQRKIIVTAGQYILKSSTDLQPRFDVVTVTHTNGEYTIDQHIKNAFH